MTLTYEDALQYVLNAVHAGEDVESAIARFSEHASALRDDLRLSQAVARMADAVPRPFDSARAEASGRLLAQLELERSQSNRRPGWPFGSTRAPRLALAAVVVAIALVGGGLLLNSGGTTVEAATIEGVVVENADGRLTVQTLDVLELVTVPADTLVSDVAGASIGLDAIAAGQVVVVDVERRGSDVVARRIQRYVESIEAWCTDASERCKALSDRLELAQEQCERSALACLVAVERLEQLRLRAAATARLEELKQACRASDPSACRQLVVFCQAHAGICGDFEPLLPPVSDSPSVAERLRDLYGRCTAGEETACRQLAQVCSQNPGLCPDGVPTAPADLGPGPETRPSDVRPEPTATASAERPAATPEAADIRPPDRVLDPTPTPPGDSQPDATPAPGDVDTRPPVEPAESQGDSRDGDTPSDRR